jgi:adenylate kinase
MGPPGSGKGTQAQLLARDFNYEHLSTGRMLRAMGESLGTSPRERKEAQKIKKGRLVADWLVYSIAFPTIKKGLKNKQGIVLDGAIRRLSQAKGFAKFFTQEKLWPEVKIIWISLTDREALRRISGRKERRADDDPKIVKQRLLTQGTKAQKPILDFFHQKRGVVISIDGNRTVPQVYKDLKKLIK